MDEKVTPRLLHVIKRAMIKPLVCVPWALTATSGVSEVGQTPRNFGILADFYQIACHNGSFFPLSFLQYSWLTNNVVIASGKQWRDSTIHIHVSILPQILNEIDPEYSLAGLMLRLKLQYFGHLMQRANSLEKTLMLGKTEGRRRRGWQRLRWLDGIINSMDMSLNKLQ